MSGAEVLCEDGFLPLTFPGSDPCSVSLLLPILTSMACALGHLHVARASLSTAVSGEFHFGAQRLPVLSVVAATSPPACRDAGKGLHLLMARRRVTWQKRTWDGRCPRAILETTVCHSLPPCCSSGPEMQVQPPAPPGCGAEPSRLLPSIPLSSSLTFLLPEPSSPPLATAHDLPLTGGPSRLLAMFPALVFSPLAFCLVACFPPGTSLFRRASAIYEATPVHQTALFPGHSDRPVTVFSMRSV